MHILEICFLLFGFLLDLLFLLLDWWCIDSCHQWLANLLNLFAILFFLFLLEFLPISFDFFLDYLFSMLFFLITPELSWNLAEFTFVSFRIYKLIKFFEIFVQVIFSFFNKWKGTIVFSSLFFIIFFTFWTIFDCFPKLINFIIQSFLKMWIKSWALIILWNNF